MFCHYSVLSQIQKGGIGFVQRMIHHLDEAKIGNAIHDFGAGVFVGDRVCNTLNPISLTMYLRNVDAVEASRILGHAFGIQPISKSHKEGDGLSDWEWRELCVFIILHLYKLQRMLLHFYLLNVSQNRMLA